MVYVVAEPSIDDSNLDAAVFAEIQSLASAA